MHRDGRGPRIGVAVVAAAIAAVVAGVAVSAAGTTNSYSPHTPAHDLWAMEATLEAQRDAVAPGPVRRRLERALSSLDWALADVHWTSVGLLADGRNGANGLRDLWTTIGRLTWVEPSVRDAYENDAVALASIVGDIARYRYDQIANFVGEGGGNPTTDPVLAASYRKLRAADGNADRVRAAATYVAVWKALVDRSPCCVGPDSVSVIGDEWAGSAADLNPAGLAEAFRTTAVASRGVTKIRMYVGPGPAPSALVAGIYTDAGGHPGDLVAQGRLDSPTADAWNVVPLDAAAQASAGEDYWVALLAPAGTGVLYFRDGCCRSGSLTETSAEKDLATLPASWTTGNVYHDGPAAAYGLS